MSGNTLLVLAALLFVATHLGISSTGLRGALVGVLGEGGYRGLYSLVGIATLGLLIYAYGRVPHGEFVYGPSLGLNWIPVVVMPFALMLVVGGVMVRNPSAVAQDESVHDPNVAQGMLRVTRHPVQMAIFLWALSHIIANGDVASLWLFGSLGVVSGLGMYLMDRKKARALGADWQRFTAATSIVPLMAIVAGRNRLALGEIWIPVVVGLALWILVLWGHQWIAGVPVQV